MKEKIHRKNNRKQCLIFFIHLFVRKISKASIAMFKTAQMVEQHLILILSLKEVILSQKMILLFDYLI
jgi:hypothetical protein